MAERMRLVLYSSVLFTPGGDVFNWVRTCTLQFSRAAKRNAPVRTGTLRRSIRAGTPRNPTLHIVSGSVSLGTPYLGYVLKGTTSPIMSTGGWALHSAGESLITMTPWRRPDGTVVMLPRAKPGSMMAVGRNPWPPVQFRFHVRGQKANNFLERAWISVAARHAALRGNPFPHTF